MPGLVQSERSTVASSPEVTNRPTQHSTRAADRCPADPDPLLEGCQDCEVTDRHSTRPADPDPLLEGYQDCASEAIRYLVEEEGRAPDDPTVLGLTEHLQARSAYLEYLTLLRRLETDMEDQLSKLLRSPESLEQEQLTEHHRHLVETVFRGCDLVLQQDVPSPAPSPPTVGGQRLYFQNNEYLDQVLSWAYTSDSC